MHVFLGTCLVWCIYKVYGIVVMLVMVSLDHQQRGVSTVDVCVCVCGVKGVYYKYVHRNMW